MNKKNILAIITCIFIFSNLVACQSNALDSATNETNKTSETTENSEEAEKKLKTQKQIEDEISIVKKTIDETAGQYSENLGIYYYNVGNGAEFTHNADKKFMGASMRKLPIVMSVADDIHNKKELSLDTMLVYNPETDKAGGSGILQGRKHIGEISISEAMNLSMTYSDNIAHKMLQRTASRNIGEYVTFVSGETMEDPYLNAKQMASLYKRLHENPDNNPIYPEILELLKKTVYHDRIDKYLPFDKVSHKIGDYYRFFHDSALVYSDNPYIVVIMSKDIGTLKPGVGDADERLLDDEGEFACEFIATMAKQLDDNLTKYHSEKETIH